MSNAIKFTKKGNVSLEVKDKSNKIEIIVKDTGIGINEKKQHSLYEPFEQGEYYLTKEYGGTGLGLAIVKKLVDLLCGEIEVKTEIGKGTEFKILIPYEEVEKKSEIITEKNREDNKISKKVRIISAEDIEINQKLLDKMLSCEEVLLKKVYTGKELIEELEENEYDLILMDIQLPVIDGLEATKLIRKNNKCKEIPIIAISAYAMEENIEKIYEAGVSDYISKPINRKELISKINKWANTKNV